MIKLRIRLWEIILDTCANERGRERAHMCTHAHTEGNLKTDCGRNWSDIATKNTEECWQVPEATRNKE